MVDIIGGNVAGDHLARYTKAAQHGGPERGVVEADARARGQSGIGVGHVSGRRGQLGSLIVIVGDIGHHPLVDVAHHVALVRAAGRQLAGLGHHGRRIVVVHEHVGHQEGRLLAVQLHVLHHAEQLNIVVARGVLHHAEIVGAIPHVHGHHDRGVVAGQVVVVAHVALAHLELQAAVRRGRRAHVALGQSRGVDGAAVARLGEIVVEGRQRQR